VDQINLGAWIDRSDVMSGGVSAQMAQTVHAVLGRHAKAAPVQGAVLPPLWHWFGFPPAVSMDALREDGHPRLSDFMPPVRLNRRMWAGGNLEFRGELHVGEPLERRTRIANIVEKTGASGDIVVLSLDHEIHGARGLAVLERQNIVYLEIPDSYAAPKAIPAPATSDITEDMALSTPLLFRYSAITFNAHRIHYDLPFAQEVEHYPDLVVHGPLQANLLMELAVRHRGFAPSMFSYRGLHPLFARDRLSLVTTKDCAAEWTLGTVANGAHQCMQANAIWEI
jgi:3-methylfumaryl-CoA hydratase